MSAQRAQQAKNKERNSFMESLETIEREYNQMQTRLHQQTNEMKQTRQDIQDMQRQIVNFNANVMNMQMEAARQRHLADVAMATIQKMLPMLPPEHRSRVQAELQNANAERMMSQMMPSPMMQQQALMMAALGMQLPPGMGGPPGGPAPGGPAPSMAMLKQQQQAAAAQQHFAANHLAQLAALSNAGAGLPPGMQLPLQVPPHGMAGPVSLSSPRLPAGFPGMPPTPTSGAAPSNGGNVATPLGTMARTRKRSSPHTPRAGDTPELGGPAVKQEPNGGSSSSNGAGASREATPLQEHSRSTDVMNGSAAAAAAAAAAMSAMTSLANSVTPTPSNGSANGGQHPFAPPTPTTMAAMMQSMPQNIQAMMAAAAGGPSAAFFSNFLQSGMVAPSS